MKTLTIAELEILNRVKKANDFGALCGLGVAPTAQALDARDFRFVKRLATSGAIIWIEHKNHGKGWALSTTAAKFCP